MAERVIQTSFSSGELSPKLYARVDLEKYGSGAALMRNFFTDYRGGASNRAGTKFIGRAKSNATGAPRLIPFIYSTDQTYILEVGNEYIRFIANQAYLTEATTTISGVTQANPAVVIDTAHGYSTGDEVEIESVGGMTELNGKNFLVVVIDANSYSLEDLNGNAIDSTGYTAYTSGGTAARIYTLAAPWAAADLPLVKYAQDADTLTLVHPSYPPYNLTRTSSTAFTLTAATFGPSLAGSSPITVSTVNEANDHSAYSYTVTAVDANGEEGTVPFPAFIATAILNQTTNTFNTIKWAAVDGAVSYRVYKAGPWAAITGGTGNATPPSVTYGFIGTAVGTTFIDVNIAPDYSQSPPTFQDPISPGQIATFNVTSGGSGYATLDWLVTITATGGGGSGFVAYGLIDPNTGTITSVWLVNPGKGYTTLPTFSDDGANTATYTATLGHTTGTYPAAVGYYQQRRFFGGTNNFPEAFFASQTGFYNNFDTNSILLDSDAISASIASRQVNAIKSFTSMPTGLVVLTTGGGFLVSGGGGGSAITPTNIVALQQPSSGCNDLLPIVVNQDILYCQNRGFVVRDLAFSFYTQSYLGTDRSVLASHLFENFLPVDWTYAEQPYRQVLVVRNDGDMLAFTYVPEQEMYAWSRYDTQGAFLSVASIPENDINAVYVLVKRHVVNPAGGACWVNYVERMDPRQFDCLLEAWFLDCALEYPLASIDSNIWLSGDVTVGGAITVTAYDPCLGEPGGSGPFDNPPVTHVETVTTEGLQNYTVRSDWNNSNNTIELLGAGGRGGDGGFYSASGAGAGQYALWQNVSLTPGQVLSIHVGVHNGATGNVGGTPAAPQDCDTYITSLAFFVAGGGNGGGSSFAGVGGNYIPPPGTDTATLRFKGGSGGTSSGSGSTGGGGGAAGPNGPGGNGAPEGSFFLYPGGGGGGGANGGESPVRSSDQSGGFGGKNRLGTGAGTGGTFNGGSPGAADGGIGADGGGGGGGAGGTDPPTEGNGGNGSMDSIWTNSFTLAVSGPGGGGGGEGPAHFSATPGQHAGAGGGRGAGGGGGYEGGGLGGDGTGGEIVFTWTVAGTRAYVGSLLQVGCGKVLITGQTDTWTLTGIVVNGLGVAVPDDPDGLLFPVPSGTWTLTPPVASLTGLDFLEGKEVWALVDGAVQGPFTVIGGAITLTTPGTNIIVGLKYQSQLQTLEIDVGNPTVQGKRKQIAATTARLNNTVGVKAGRTFAGVVPMKEAAATTPPSMFSGDARTVINAAWDKPGQVCYQQDDPLPVTILGVIPEVVVGDTGK